MANGLKEADDEIDRLVRHFCSDERTYAYGPYVQAGPPGRPLGGAELIPGRLRLYRLVDRDGRRVDLHVYAGLADIGGLLWEQEVRVLLRLGASGLHGLPEILSGGYESAESTARAGAVVGGVAFIATRGSGSTLADPGAADFMREHPTLALSQFGRLANALAELHDLGVLHRNLTPATIQADLADERSPRLWIARFEMSALIGNLFRRNLDSGADRSELGTLLLGRAPTLRTLAYHPPERVRFLFPTGEDERFLESPTSDVYGLAATVCEWFYDPARLPDGSVSGASPGEVRERHTRTRREMTRLLTASPKVPHRLASLLAEMLAEEPRNRPTAAEVVTRLGQDAEGIRLALTGTERTRPYLVAHMPELSNATLYRWGCISQPADTPMGRDELAKFIVDDLRNARLLHSPKGAEPFAERGDLNDRLASHHVLLGKNIAWFCRSFQRKTWGRLGPPLPEALIVKYVARRHHPSARRRLEDLLAQSSFAPEVAAIDTVAFDVAEEVMEAELLDRPSWTPLLDLLDLPSQESQQDLEYGRALDWMLQYQGAQLRARTYAFVRIDQGAGDVTVEWDRERDKALIDKNTLLRKFADSPRLRPAFGDFFGNLDDEEGDALVEVVEDDRGTPSRSSRGSEWIVQRRTGEDRVTLRRPARGSGKIPQRGWIRPLSDKGTNTALRRQTAARVDLMDARGLLRQLRSPNSIKHIASRWQRAGSGLLGEDGPEIVRAMLTYQPFFAVQGPPGTGKTTVVAEAVAAYLADDSTARVLVSAQSNYALDNLAQRILQKVGAMNGEGMPSDDWAGVAMRITSRSGARHSPQIEPWTLERLTDREAMHIRVRVRLRLDGGVGNEPLHRALERWNRLLDPSGEENVQLELGDRLKRAANLVFATCATSTAEAVTSGGTRSRFDWVIVEEAAKAWPTELAMPLARGTRWTLIGDHRQLGAHRRQDFESFLNDCASDRNEEIAQLYRERESLLRAFDTFRNLFGNLDDVELSPSARERLPLRQLSTQFRMRAPIAEVVSRVFYPKPGPVEQDGLPRGGLATAEGIGPLSLRRPVEFIGESLIWLDTSDIPDCADVPRWSNPGEAKVVDALVKRLKPDPVPYRNGYSGEPLAVLTPYRQQLEELRQYASVRDHLSTVHAFQGREADIVLVSLVRSTPRGKARGALSSLGHLTEPNLINVMLSRARKLLVIVGNFQHFAQAGAEVEFWARLCTAVRIYGTVLPAGEVTGS